MCHEAVYQSAYAPLGMRGMRNTLCYAFQHRSRLENESRERHTAQVGTRTQLGYNVGEHVALLRIHDSLVLLGRLVAAIVSSCLVYGRCAAT
jgi:hypothetical protein